MEAVWNEWQHARRLADVREVGRPRTRRVEVLPALTTGHLGLRVRF